VPRLLRSSRGDQNLIEQLLLERHGALAGALDSQVGAQAPSQNLLIELPPFLAVKPHTPLLRVTLRSCTTNCTRSDIPSRQPCARGRTRPEDFAVRGVALSHTPGDTTAYAGRLSRRSDRAAPRAQQRVPSRSTPDAHLRHQQILRGGSRKEAPCCTASVGRPVRAHSPISTLEGQGFPTTGRVELPASESCQRIAQRRVLGSPADTTSSSRPTAARRLNPELWQSRTFGARQGQRQEGQPTESSHLRSAPLHPEPLRSSF
jgi:hypothetical protein